MRRFRFLPDFQRPRPTINQQELVEADADRLLIVNPDHPSNYVDISLATPDQQFAALASTLEANDAANPAPNTHTPPFGEPITEDEYISQALQEEEYLVHPEMQSSAEFNFDHVINDAWPSEIPHWTWYNDQQYFGLGVPPGVPNYGQPIESGHTQISIPNPSAELGWDAWSGRTVLARVARMENNFPGYSADVNRRHNMPPVLKYERQAWIRTQQARDLIQAEIMRRGIHNVVVSDIPQMPYTEQVRVIDPAILTVEAEIGPEGVLP